jgi:hypothetical protein
MSTKKITAIKPIPDYGMPTPEGNQAVGRFITSLKAEDLAGQAGRYRYDQYSAGMFFNEIYRKFDNLARKFPEAMNDNTIQKLHEELDTLVAHWDSKEKIRLKGINPTSLRKIDRYSFECDYETETDPGTPGNYDSYTRIYNARVSEIFPQSIVNKITERSKDSTLNYFAERVIAGSPIMEPSYWDVIVSPYYYGDEIAGATCGGPAVDKIQRQLETLDSQSLNKLVESAIEGEFGYLPESVKDCKWELLTVKRDEVELEIEENYRKLDKAAIEKYAGYKGIMGTAIKTKKGYKLVDGHHRFVANPKLKEVQIFVGSKELSSPQKKKTKSKELELS